MNLYSDNGLSRYLCRFVTGVFFLCGSAAHAQGVDEAWNNAPATYDTTWAQLHAGQVTSGHNSSGARKLLYSGRSTTVTVGIDPAMTTLYVSFDLDGRGVTQQMVDIEETVGRGNFRVYNRGGENADRPYDALIRVSRSGNTLTLKGEGVWTGAPVIYTVVGYSS